MMVVIATFTGTAAADDAASWKQRGDDAIEAGRAAEALEAYRRAAAIAPSPALEFNVGRALLATGDFVAALDAFERYEATAPEDLKKKTFRLAEIMAELRAKIVSVDVHGDAGARVIVDGLPACTLPCASMRHNPGPIEVRVERDDYRPFVERRQLAPGAAAVFEATLVAVPIEAHLVVVARPAAARVVVDGIARGTTPMTLVLPPGSHDVALDAASYEPKKTTVVLGRDESRRLDLELSPEKRPVTTRWWFWTGIGVVVAGGAALAIALSTERSPHDGSLGTVHVP